MQEACIIIMYHTGVEELTQRHCDRFKQFNPEIPIVMIKHEDFELLPYWNYDSMWHSNDSIMYRWFLSDKKILAERYFIFDYDTYCNDSIKNYYKNVWDEQAACSDHFSIQQDPNWSWFEKHQEELSIYKDKLYGIVPPVGLMLKHDVLNNLIQEQINNSIWKNIFLELRMGSILNINGVKIAHIDKNKKHYISPFTHVVPQNYKKITGIFHPVKNNDYISESHNYNSNIIKYNMKINGVIHVGGNVGEEIPQYRQQTNNIHMFEPLKECFDQIDNSINKYNVGLGSKKCTLEFNIAINKQSSSFLKPKLHLEKHSWVTFNEPKRLIHIDTLDSYNIVDCNFLHMDTQGYELEILKGSEETLKYIDYIYTEINIMELYENCVQLEELDEYLKSKNFIRTELILTGYGAGDALYIKKLGENLK